MTCCGSDRNDDRTRLVYLDADSSVSRDTVSSDSRLTRELESVLCEVDRSVLHEEADTVAYHILVSKFLEGLTVSKIPLLACSGYALGKVFRNLDISSIPTWVTCLCLDDSLVSNIELVTYAVNAWVSCKLCTSVDEDSRTAFCCSSSEGVT